MMVRIRVLRTIFLVFFLISLSIVTPILAVDAHAASKKRSPAANSNTRVKKLAPPGAKRREMSVRGSLAPGEETAVRKIGISIFPPADVAPRGYSMRAAVEFCETLASQLILISYLRASCLKQRMPADGGGAAFIELGQKHGVDAILVGTVEGRNLRMWLHSGRTGRRIASLKVGTPAVYNETDKNDFVLKTVDALVGAVPYRGHVLSVRADKVEINLGSRHGIEPGTLLGVFEFSGTPAVLSGPRSALGIVEITEVKGETLAVAKIIEGHGKIVPFAKIAHEDPAPPRQVATARVVKQGMWFSAGTEILSVSTMVDKPENMNRAYVMHSTPLVQLGLGAEKWFGYLSYGYATNTEASLAYLSAVGAYQLKTFGNSVSGLTVSLGGWISQYTATLKRSSSSGGTSTPLLDSNRMSFFLEGRYQKVLLGRMKLFAAGESYFPVKSDGQLSGMLPFSFGFGFTPGFKVDLTDGIALEAGARVQYLSLPIAARAGTAETHTAFFLRGILIL